MLLALGAASAALDALTSLVSPKPASSKTTTGFNQASVLTADTSTTGATASVSGTASQGGCLSPATMSALLAAQGQSSASSTSTSSSDALKDLFSKLDANGDGQISKSEFENALGAGGTNVAQADDVFGKMDKDGDGSVSLDEMSSSLKGAGGHRHHHHPAQSADGTNGAGTSTDALLQALQGASSTSVTNSDGSTTTSLTYADGSKVTLTSPAAAAASAASSSAASSYNFIEQAIQREAQALFSSPNSSLSVSV